MSTRRVMLAAGAGVVIALAGCESQPKDVGGTDGGRWIAEGSIAPRALGGPEDNDNVIHVVKADGTDYRMCFGALTDPNCVVEGFAPFPSPEFTFSSDGCDYFVYVTGTFAQPADTRPGVAPSNILRVVWHVVITDRVKAGAQGTSFIVFVSPSTGVQKVVRLGETTGGTVSVQRITDPDHPQSMASGGATDQVVVYTNVSGTETLGAPVAAGENERELIAEAKRRAVLHGLPVPDSP